MEERQAKGRRGRGGREGGREVKEGGRGGREGGREGEKRGRDNHTIVTALTTML